MKLFSTAAVLVFASWYASERLQAQTPLQITFGTRGLQTLQFGGADRLADGAFRLRQVLLRQANGQVVEGSTTASIAVDSRTGEVRATYPWGTVTAQYSVTDNRLSLSMTVRNTSAQTIQSIALEPLSLRFDRKPDEYDGTTPILFHNIGSPTVLELHSDTLAAVLANDDLDRPLSVGFPFAANPPDSTVFPIRVSTGRTLDASDSFPVIDRPVAPGASDTYQISIRLGDASKTRSELAADIYERFADAHPVQFGWTDRRPIGALFLSSSDMGFTLNPRGWFLDASVDVTTSEGRAQFQRRVLAYADQAVQVLKDMNAQGMIVWDIEGQQYSHPISYIGDPRLVSQLAPEMDEVADRFFQRFRDAGLSVGLVVRPQRFVMAGDEVSQQADNSPDAVLQEKISYAKARWGATLFYVDSNGGPAMPMDSAVLNRVAARNRDVLLIPEHKNFSYYAFSAPYYELRTGTARTPDEVRAGYCRYYNFSVINTADGPVDAKYKDLEAAVRNGDILMFRGWYTDPVNDPLKALAQTIPAAIDYSTACSSGN